MDEDIDQGMVVEALLLLAEIDPLRARILYLHKVEKQTELQVAEAFGRSERQLRRLLNGEVRGKQYVWGAIDWMRSILKLFREAQRWGGYSQVIFLLSFAVGRNPTREPFTVTMLDMLWEAMECRQLEQFLSVLDQARKEKEKYGRLLTSLLDCYDTEQLDLDQCLRGLCPVSQVKCVMVTLLRRN